MMKYVPDTGTANISVDTDKHISKANAFTSLNTKLESQFPLLPH